MPARTNFEGPQIRPNQCWAQMYRHPRVEENQASIVTRDTTVANTVTDAITQVRPVSVTVREAATNYRVIEPKYKAIEEKVEVSAEVRKLVVVPAVYEERDLAVLVESAKIVLRPCNKAGQRAVSASRQERQQSQCVQEEPAVYKTVRQKVLVTPESVREEVTPARYTTMTRWVLQENGRAEPYSIPESQRRINYRAVVKDAQVEQTTVPAQTVELPVKMHIGPPSLTWQQVLCEQDLSKTLVSELQGRLKAQEHDPGAIDGILGQKTWRALRDYQLRQGLATGFISYETLTHLGLSLSSAQD